MKTDFKIYPPNKNGRYVIFGGSFLALAILSLTYFAIQDGGNKNVPVLKGQTSATSASATKNILMPSQAVATANSLPASPSRVSQDVISTPVPDVMNAEIVVKDKHVKLTGSDGLYDRVILEAKVPIHVKVGIPNLSPGQDIILSAPNGGNLSVADGSPLRFKATADSQTLDLVFQPGKSLGAYSIIILHQGQSQTLDFWVGPQAPLGQPGPPNQAASSTSLDSISQNL